jgi:hypothetical protein
VSPSEFWGMTTTELWWLYETKVPQEQRDKASGEYWQEMYEVLKSG